MSTQLIRNNYWLNKKRNTNIKYLNYGFESASIFYFGKHIGELTKAEQIALITIPKNSNKYNPINNKESFQNRFKIISNYLYKNKLINKTELTSILNEKLFFIKGSKNKLPYITDFIKSKKIKSNHIKTTIDYNLSKKINSLALNSILKLLWKNVNDYGVILIDRKSSELLSMLGGASYYGKEGQVNSTLSLRQAGSTIKPFTYTLAFKNLGLKPSSTILDLPIQFKTIEGNLYSPKNYSLKYSGEVTLAEALSQSINIPVIKLANQVGINKLLNFLKSLNITSLNKGKDYYGLALTLGTGEISLYELSRAYSIFANNGIFCDIKYLKGEKINAKSW